MNYYIADTHFGHENIIRLDSRPFKNANEMDYALIELWNSRVSDNDDVYIIGDFAFRNTKPEEWYLEQLKGRKHLIIGNHDEKLCNNEKAVKHFVSVDKMLQLTDDVNQLCLCHFPLAEWDGYFKGYYHIYAHIHNRTDGAYAYISTLSKALNAGCMINGYMPVTFKELVHNNEVFRNNNPAT